MPRYLPQFICDESDRFQVTLSMMVWAEAQNVCHVIRSVVRPPKWFNVVSFGVQGSIGEDELEFAATDLAAMSVKLLD